MITQIIAKAIVHGLPPAKWYGAAFAFTRFYKEISAATSGSWVGKRYIASKRLNHAQKLEALLTAILRHAPCFPIPVAADEEFLRFLRQPHPNGLMICTVHTPLNLASVNCLVKEGVMPDGIVARFPPSDGYLTIPGTDIRIPAILVDAAVLLKTRAILKRGGTIITSVDNVSDGRFSPNQFLLVEKMKADLVVCLVELQPDGFIKIKFISSWNASSANTASLSTFVESTNEKALDFLAAY